MGSLKLLLIAGAIGFLSTLISYGVVRTLAKDMAGENAVDPAVLRRANILRDFGNELAVLGNAYHDRIPPDPTRASPQSLAWVENVVRPELQFLQRRMDEVIREGTTESIRLEAAVARCAVMARHPGDSSLRTAALREAAAAIQEVEAWIAVKGVEKRLSRPAVHVAFP